MSDSDNCCPRTASNAVIKPVETRFKVKMSWSTWFFMNVARASISAIVGYKAYENMPNHPFFSIAWILFGATMVVPRVEEALQKRGGEYEI